MQVSQALADAFAAHRGMEALTAQLQAAGHLSASQGLQVDGRTLVTSDASGNPAELPPGAQALVSAFVPPAAPPAVTYGAELLTDDQVQQQAAAIVAGLIQYRGLASPTLPQTAQAVKALAQIAIYLIRQRFPNL